jgi:hypothetical protein
LPVDRGLLRLRLAMTAKARHLQGAQRRSNPDLCLPSAAWDIGPCAEFGAIR